MNDKASPGGPPPLPGFHILVPVWGDAHSDLFTQVSLPSQLAPCNLPSLPHKEYCLYHLLTRPEDAERIRASEAWRQLESLMPVRIDLYSDQKQTPYETMSAYLREGIDLADKNDAASLFFNPDLVFADGTIDALVQCVRNGRRIIFSTGIRLLKETVLPELDRYRTGANAISISSRDLVATAMRNLHPISQQNFWTDRGGTFVPATIFWPVGNEGLLARCFHLHPLLVWPERKHVHFRGTVDDDFVSMACPNADTDYVVTDSDELLVCEISAFSRAAEAGYRKGSINDVVNWAESSTDQRHRRLATFPIRIHATAMTESLWTAAETASSQVIDEVLRRLDRSSLILFLRSPMRLFRRWVRRAATTAISERNVQRESTWRARIAAGYLGFYRRYSAFSARYESFRARLTELLFGSPVDPYPWNGHWFTSRNPARAALQLVPSRHEHTLIIAPAPNVRRRIAQSFAHAELMEWPQHGVATADARDHWPYGDGVFDLVVCVGELQLPQQPDGFIAELARILAPGGHAVIVTPLHSARHDAASHDCDRSFLNATEARLPPTLQVERSTGVGGLGSTLAVRLYRWSENQRRVRRISPVILEIPILPLLIVLRLVAGCAAALGATICDLLDRSGRFFTDSAVLLVRTGRSERSPSTR